MENVLETERQFLTEQANSLYNVNEINTDVEADFKIKLKALLKTLKFTRQVLLRRDAASKRV
jgi:hypothetical protein